MSDKLVKSKILMAKKKVQIQGAQILSDDTYFSYVEETKDAVQPKAKIDFRLFTKPSSVFFFDKLYSCFLAFFVNRAFFCAQAAALTVVIIDRCDLFSRRAFFGRAVF